MHHHIKRVSLSRLRKWGLVELDEQNSVANPSSHKLVVTTMGSVQARSLHVQPTCSHNLEICFSMNEWKRTNFLRRCERERESWTILLNLKPPPLPVANICSSYIFSWATRRHTRWAIIMLFSYSGGGCDETLRVWWQSHTLSQWAWVILVVATAWSEVPMRTNTTGGW